MEEYKELQKLARRIVSQCMSSSGCERNWSTFALVHTKLRNRLGYDKLHKLVYVHYNLKLRIQHFEADLQSFQEMQSLEEKESDPCSIMMDCVLYDEGNPIMDWLCNSLSESTPTLDEHDDNEPESPNPCRLVIDGLQIEADELASFKRKLSFGTKGGTKKGKVGLEEQEEGTADDYESNSSHGSPIYAESGDSSSNDSEGDGAAGSEGTRDGGAGGSGARRGRTKGTRLEQLASSHPKSTRLKKASLKGLYTLQK